MKPTGKTKDRIGLTGKLIVVALIGGIVVAFWALGLGRYLTLSYLKTSADGIKAFYAGRPVFMVLGYFMVYVATTSLSLPGAVVLTIAGGALFGVLTGTVIVSFASSIGATIACFVSRYVLRTWAQNALGGRIAKINEGIEKEGAFYLFTLRLIPLFPFWMINLAMGLTKMPLRRFYWVTQFGTLPGTIVYINAGRELASIESLKGILSPGLIISFALIGILPLAAKKSITLYREKRRGAG
jgi:uncharacterized membrane protein YdjX (TVP38/TMEM64 family)